jgi:hypothetical protein
MAPGEEQSMGFRVLIVGGTGQVGLAARSANLPVPISRTVNRYLLRHVPVGKDSQQWNE